MDHPDCCVIYRAETNLLTNKKQKYRQQSFYFVREAEFAASL